MAKVVQCVLVLYLSAIVKGQWLYIDVPVKLIGYQSGKFKIIVLS